MNTIKYYLSEIDSKLLLSFCLLICLTFFVRFVGAQGDSYSNGITVNYLFTAEKKGSLTSSLDFPLYVMDNTSMFIQDSDQAAGATTTTDDAGNLRANIVIDDGEGQLFYVDQHSKLISSRQLILDEPIMVEEPIPDFDWQITGKSKTVAEHQSFEATTTFRGRDYSAWFAPDIPVNAGPWKFSGLPGLILEVNDHDKQYNWYCQSIKKLTDEQADLIRKPKGSKPMSHAAFYELQLEKFMAFFQKMTAGNNVEITSGINTDRLLERTK